MHGVGTVRGLPVGADDRYESGNHPAMPGDGHLLPGLDLVEVARYVTPERSDTDGDCHASSLRPWSHPRGAMRASARASGKAIRTCATVRCRPIPTRSCCREVLQTRCLLRHQYERPA